ncbi:MAG TPA: prepilin-type N-terminal cleavage/methylation domain-containing protein [Pyrinomonadaceae bacterium]|jgi:prepilin-type N-terminal cleavage/methylation domain-containing protein
MKELAEDGSLKTRRRRGERGFSLIEMLIVVAMIGIVSGFALLRISAAQRSMRLTNSTRELMGYLEKARLDSVRRHAMATGEMANVTIESATSYTINIDQDGDGAFDPPRTITIPPQQGVSFAGITFPTVIRYNWRGRPVDGAGNVTSFSFSMGDGTNSNPVTLTNSGDASMTSGNANLGNINISSGTFTDSKLKIYPQ